MSVSPELKKFVDDGDLVQIRCFLANYLVVDRTFALFDESLAYASMHLSVIQEHDGGVLEQDKTLWDRDYLNKQVVASFSNFSNERISHIKEVVSFIVSRSESPKMAGNISVKHSTDTPKTGRTVVGEKEASNNHSTSARKETASREIGGTESSVISERTGRRVIKESDAARKPTTSGHSVSTPHKTGAHDVGTSSGRTGRRVISETETEKRSDEDPSHLGTSGKFDASTAMIVGGAALVAVGVAVVEPVVIGTGVAVAGLGIAVKVSNNRK